MPYSTVLRGLAVLAVLVLGYHAGPVTAAEATISVSDCAPHQLLATQLISMRGCFLHMLHA
jgi:hypothetical protein